MILRMLIWTFPVASPDHVIDIMGGTGTGPDLVMKGLANAFNSKHSEEAHVQPWLAGGSKTLSALVGNVDCQKNI